jgi:hypothetical protein
MDSGSLGSLYRRTPFNERSPTTNHCNNPQEILHEAIIRVTASAAGLLAALSAPADVHFFQPVGDGTVGFFVGFILEPCYEGEPNGIEIFAQADIKYDAKGNPLRFRHINEDNNDINDPATHPEDKVRLKATVQVLEAADPKAKVLGEKDVGPLRLAQAPQGRYIVEFRPYPGGIYAFKIQGTVNGQRFNGRMICSLGNHETFTCPDGPKAPAPDVFPPR